MTDAIVSVAAFRSQAQSDAQAAVRCGEDLAAKAVEVSARACERADSIAATVL